MKVTSKGKKKQVAVKPKVKFPRRIAFARELETISRDVVRSELKLDSLKEPRKDSVSRLFSSLIGQELKRKKQAELCPSGTFPTRNDGYVELEEGHEAEGGLGSSLGTHASEMPLDDGISVITAGDDFVTFRLRPVLEEKQSLVRKLTFYQTLLQTITFVSTAVNAALALTGFKLWVPMVVAIVSALIAIMDFEMLAARIGATNDAIATLQNQLLWWGSLSMIEKRLPQRKETLVMVTESVVGADNVWARRGTADSQKKGKSEDDEQAEEEEDKDTEGGKGKDKDQKGE